MLLVPHQTHPLRLRAEPSLALHSDTETNRRPFPEIKMGGVGHRQDIQPGLDYCSPYSSSLSIRFIFGFLGFIVFGWHERCKHKHILWESSYILSNFRACQDIPWELFLLESHVSLISSRLGSQLVKMSNMSALSITLVSIRPVAKSSALCKIILLKSWSGYPWSLPYPWAS